MGWVSVWCLAKVRVCYLYINVHIYNIYIYLIYIYIHIIIYVYIYIYIYIQIKCFFGGGMAIHHFGRGVVHACLRNVRHGKPESSPHFEWS